MRIFAVAEILKLVEGEDQLRGLFGSPHEPIVIELNTRECRGDCRVVRRCVGNRPAHQLEPETERRRGIERSQHAVVICRVDHDEHVAEVLRGGSHHDVHDWDANQIPVLVDAEFNGRPRQLLVMANRNGFFYVLDRKTGEYLLGEPYAKQTWAKGLDEKGRPVLIAGMDPSEKGTLVYPSLQGSTNWASPSYSPLTGLLYVPVREMGSIYYKTGVEYKPGTYYTGGSEKRLDEESWGAVRALDVKTGKKAWDFMLPTPTWAGVMATAGGLVFSGSNEGNFYALDATTGKALWQFQTGGPIRSGPMSFAADGKQYVAVSGGHVDRRQQRRDQADSPQDQMTARVRPEQDFVLAEESGQAGHAGNRNRTDQKRPVRQRQLVLQAAHTPKILLTRQSVNHGA